MAGISNEAIDDFIEKVNDTDLKNNYIGVFPSNLTNKFISHHSIIKSKPNVKYPFIIMNTDRSDRNGTHWWSFVDLHPKKDIFLFDSFGFNGLKKFIIDNDEKLLNEILFNLKTFGKKDKKITLISLSFSMLKYQKAKRLNELRTTTQDLLHLMYEFGKLHDVKDEINVLSVDDQLQRIDTDTCGIFQLYFYYNLFNPLKSSSIIENTSLGKSTIEKLLNEIFCLDQDINEKTVSKFALEHNIR